MSEKNMHDHTEIAICCSIAARLIVRGASYATITQAFKTSRRLKTSFCQELVLSGNVTEADYYQAAADIFALEFRKNIKSSRIVVDHRLIPDDFSSIRHVMVVEDDGRNYLYLAPTLKDLNILRCSLEKDASLSKRLRICPASVLANFMRLRHSEKLAENAHTMTPPIFSARRVLQVSQAFMLAFIFYGVFSLLYFFPWPTIFGFHFLLSFFFFGCVILRLHAVLYARRIKAAVGEVKFTDNMPIYSVLVPLYREKNVLAQLVGALDKLQWPRAKLDIKLVCEADDHETLDALVEMDLPPTMEIIKVPDIGPRTKPKALNYALQCARGEFVVIYDAEDRPHPHQLLEAWKIFSTSDSSLACLQAPLIIANFRKNFLTRMFAFEYAGLFRSMLPWLASRNLVVPLGGTSNHLRRECLHKVGGWDAYNVTEDADLGLRLARGGFRIGVLNHATVEDAPENFIDWRNQRTRWQKGWMQTLLVHWRNPVALYKELGPKRFFISQIYMGGLVISAFFHPLMLLTLVLLVWQLLSGMFSSAQVGLFALDMINIILAYLSYYLIGIKSMEPVESRGYFYFGATVLYWFLISLSSWRACWQLFRMPFLWEKTPHYASQQDGVAGEDVGGNDTQSRSDGMSRSLPYPMIRWSSSLITSRSRPA